MTRFETGVARKGKERISNDTVWTELNKLSSCISWCVKTGHIKGMSAEWEPVWLPPRSIKGEEVLMLDDVKKLLDACFFVVDTPQGKQRHAMWHLYFYTLLAMCTAARPTALLELTGDRCLFGDGTIDLRVKEEFDPMSKAFKKGRAIVHMSDLARSTLLEAKALVEENGGVWERSAVIQWRGGSIGRINKGFAKRLGPRTSCGTRRLRGLTRLACILAFCWAIRRAARPRTSHSQHHRGQD